MTDQGAKMSGGIPALHICTYAECDKTGGARALRSPVAIVTTQ